MIKKMKKQLATIIFISLFVGCVSPAKKNEGLPSPLFCKPNQSEIKIEKLKENKIKYFYRGKTFCRISKNDRDKDGKHDDFLQNFYFDSLFLTVSNMGKTKNLFAFCPVKDLYVDVCELDDRPGVEQIMIIHAKQKVFLVFERSSSSDFFVPASQENAEKTWESTYKIFNIKENHNK